MLVFMLMFISDFRLEDSDVCWQDRLGCDGCTQCSPDSSHFITASADKTVKLWNAETLVCEQTLSMSSDPQINDAQVMKCLKPSHLY